jgi:hypothetical protein
MANATSDSLAIIAKRSAEDNEDMTTLTILARDDAKVMKFIAVLTMIYLPSSAISVSLPKPNRVMSSAVLAHPTSNQQNGD